MEPDVLEDIRAIERLQDEDLLMAGVDYSATRRYAELLHRALAAWNNREAFDSADDCDALMQWRADSACGVVRREWNPVLRKYWKYVWGGLIAEIDDDKGGAPLPFWHRPEVGWPLFEGVLIEATTMASHIMSRGPDDKWEVVGRMGGDAVKAELSENFCRISRKARETVEREAKASLPATSAPKPAMADETERVKDAYSKGLEKGRLKGHDEILARDKSRDEAKGKEWMTWGCSKFKEKVFEFVREHIQSVGEDGALRLALKQKWVRDGAMHYRVFAADKGKKPTFDALDGQYDTYKKKPHVKPTKQRPRKTRPCDFADGVKVDLPKEKYRE